MPSFKKKHFCTKNAILPMECVSPVKIEKHFAILVFAVTIFIHLFCAVCLITAAILQSLHTEWEARVNGMGDIYITFITHFGCAALHIEGIFAICRPNKLVNDTPTDKDRVLTFNRKHENQSRFYTFLNYIRTLIDAFGIDGQYFDLGIIILEVIEILAASYQAYLMSRNTSHRLAAFLFTLLILANCMITPLIMHYKNGVKKRYLTLIVDGIFDFLYSVSFALGILAKKGFENYTDEKAKVLYNDQIYVTKAVYDVRQIFTSGVALFFNLIPFIITFVTFRSLTIVIRRDINCKPATNLSRNTSKVKSNGIINRASFFLTRQVRIVQCCFLLWGIIVSYISVKALSRDNCHESCVLQVYPWFNTKCMCIAFRVNCKKMNISTENMYKELSLASRDLFAIEISQCNLSGGPKIQNFQRFDKLFWLNLMFNQIDEWQPEEYHLPKNLGRFHLDGSNLTKIPGTLVNNIPESLGVLFIDNSKITEISSNISMNWNNLFHLRFRHTLIKTFPIQLLMLPNLKSLDFRFNLLHELVLPSTSGVQTLDVTYNQISTIPTGLFEKLPRLNQIFLDGNPINKIPESYQTYIFEMKKFSVSQTNLCTRLMSNKTLFSNLELQMTKKRQHFCGNSCSGKCMAKSLGDKFCDLECHTKNCNWDEEDCSRFEFS